MVRHLVCWKFKPEVSAEKRAEIAKEFSDRLQKVKERLDGTEEVRVIYPPLSTSSMDIVLDSSFVSEEALATYQTDPEHLAAGAACVKPYMTDRTCCDYEY